MEVHVRNVPAKSTENALKKFLKPYFAHLSIRSVSVQKRHGKNFASLTFLSFDDGQRFLTRHGQITSRPGDGRPVRNKPATSQYIRFLGQPIYCERSKNPADQYLLRVLTKEENDRKAKAAMASDIQQPKSSHSFPVNFTCGLGTTVSCGTWKYNSSGLVFVPEVTWYVASSGKAKFGERSMILTLDTGIRIDFHYWAIYEIVMEDGRSPSLIFSMLEAPRFFRKADSALEELFAQLALTKELRQVAKRISTDRQRIPFIDDQHRSVVGSCFVYRIGLLNDQATSTEGDITARFQTLQKSPVMPPMTHRHVNVSLNEIGFDSSFRRLKTTLSSLTSDLSFGMSFQLQKLAQDGYLRPEPVLELVPEVRAMSRRSSQATCVSAIRKLFNQIPWAGPQNEATDFDVGGLIELLKENEVKCQEEALLLEETIQKSTNVAIIHRAKVTPTGIHLFGPEAETNNRVLRKYPNHHEYFLRVQFCDEDGQPVRFNPRVSNEKIFQGRFLSVLNNGINIAGREYAFLGFSHSSLRAQSCWFVAPFLQDGSLVYDRMVIQQLGNFSLIQSPAKCAARIGQAFSDTRTAVTIDPKNVKIIPDVDYNDRVFSDGVGTISLALMQKLWDSLPKARYAEPRLFQIRFQGAKGMISLDSRLEGEVLNLRPSMIKFEDLNSSDIEICEASYRPLPMYLNRQFIKILEDMGTDDKFFLDLQAEEVARLRAITENPINAANFLKRQSIGQNIRIDWLIKRLATLGIDFRRDGFLKDVVEMALLIELRLLKHKTRIPVEKGWHLHGLMDETGFLKEGEIFCSVTVEGRTHLITGKNLIVSRAPALHPGDVQLARGVTPPLDSPLWQLSNCICFSSKGDRDLPSQLSGGDLDGDRYYIMWDKRAQPKHTFTPADYARLPAIDIGRPVERSDMTDFFIKFMETDQLGRIAVTHRVLADQKEQGTCDPSCIILAEMHSTAVDFSKTGIPVDMSKMPRFQPWRPDFEAPGPHVIVQKLAGVNFEPPDPRDPDEQGDEDDDFSNYRYYESNKVLGKLYRAIDEREIFEKIKQRSLMHGITRTSTVIDEVWNWVQQRCRLIVWEHHKEWAGIIRDMYEEKISNIMINYSEHPLRPLTELEAFIGNILGKTGAQSRHQRELSTTMKERFEEESLFIMNCIVKDDKEYSEESLERSMAVLWSSLQERRWKRGQLVAGDEGLLSFKYVAAGVCLREVDRFLGL